MTRLRALVLSASLVLFPLTTSLCFAQIGGAVLTDLDVHRDYAFSAYSFYNEVYYAGGAGLVASPAPGSYVHADIVYDVETGQLRVQHEAVFSGEPTSKANCIAKLRETATLEAHPYMLFEGTVTVDRQEEVWSTAPEHEGYLRCATTVTQTDAVEMVVMACMPDGSLFLQMSTYTVGWPVSFVRDHRRLGSVEHEEWEESLPWILLINLREDMLEAVDPLVALRDYVVLAEPERSPELTAPTEKLAAARGVAYGAAADGETRLLLRARSPAAGLVTFTLSGPGELQGLDGGVAGTSLTEYTVSVGDAAYAFCLYAAPDGLPPDTAPETAAEVTASFPASSPPVEPATLSLRLLQPPVVLLHGLWSFPTAWDAFPLNANGQFPVVVKKRYDSAAHFTETASAVQVAAGQARAWLAQKGVAGCRADVIGHSMGGLLARYWAREASTTYRAQRNWYGGDVRRIITLDTPHRGSWLANELIALGPGAAQIARALGHPVDGAIEDLCVGSPALSSLGESDAPGHSLVGNVQRDFGDTFWALFVAHGMLKMDPLLTTLGIAGASLYNTQTLFGGPDHDFVVSCFSQAGGLTGPCTKEFDGLQYAHCAVTASADYAAECARLLTAPLSPSEFAPFPPITTWVAEARHMMTAIRGATREGGPAPRLQITSPSEGATVTPGSAVTVVIEVPADLTLLGLGVGGPSTWGRSEAVGANQVEVVIPEEAAGDYPVVAVGYREDGGIEYSPTLHVRVDLGGAVPTELRFAEEQATVQPGDRLAGSLLVDCADGLSRVLPGGSSGLSYESTDPDIASVATDGTVTALAPGECAILAGYGGLLAVLPVIVCTPTRDFADVPTDHWAFYSIRAAFRADIVAGYRDGTYHPTSAVTRDQMAVYISRALAGGDGNVCVPTSVGEPTFSDVGEGHWAYRYVEYCARVGIVQGYPGGIYHPDEVVNRGQMAVYVARAVAGGDGAVPPDADGATFTDVTETNEWSWCYRYVEYCAAAGTVQGYWDGTYRAGNEVTRDQMAVYVARAFGLSM
jgi:pimeloyl-ACP methyl ester carboxylesterase